LQRAQLQALRDHHASALAAERTAMSDEVDALRAQMNAARHDARWAAAELR
jgi:outer membrane murein-binding lipoprotein Lpp